MMGNLPVGMQLGILVFSDHKRTTGVEVVESSNPEHVQLRGKFSIQFTSDAVSIKGAIERAGSKGMRKDSFQDFLASWPTTSLLSHLL
ncbi:UNVERIFIED_CONTAM: hypothetical protein C7454_12558 [Acidovorax defluvii]